MMTLNGFGRLARHVMLVVLVAAIAGCAAFEGPKYPPAPVAAATPDYNYVVGAGDTLNIIVWRNPELSMSVPVRPDGKVVTPLVDELVAQGKTSIQIARDIETALSKFVRDPIVTVIITGFVGPYSEQIRVVGEAARPQAMSYKQKNDATGCDDRCRGVDRFCRWQFRLDTAPFRG